MESVIVALFIGLALTPGTLFFYWALKDILDEQNFKDNAFRTMGTVVLKTPVKYGSEEYMGQAGVKYTSETFGGYFFTIEYPAADGTVYSYRPRKVFNENKEWVDVWVKKDDPTDIMVDGFYKVGNSKYYQLIAGAVFGPIPLLILLFNILADLV